MCIFGTQIKNAIWGNLAKEGSTDRDRICHIVHFERKEEENNERSCAQAIQESYEEGEAEAIAALSFVVTKTYF